MDRNLRRISIALAVLGMLVAAYMTIYKLTDNQTMCLGSGGCSVVNNSIYSEVYGVPVALVGFIGYAAIVAVLALKRLPAPIAGNSVMIAFGLCLAGFLFNLYLIYVEVVLIKAYCPFCIASQTVMMLLFALSVVRLVREPIA